jgi:hypothetical protein
VFTTTWHRYEAAQVAPSTLGIPGTDDALPARAVAGGCGRRGSRSGGGSSSGSSSGSGSGAASFDFPALGDRLACTVASYSTLHVKRGCLGAASDHFAMWEIGVPAVVYSEHNPFANPHFDAEGGDTFAKIDTAYLTSIARPGITFQAQLAGVVK